MENIAFEIPFLWRISITWSKNLSIFAWYVISLSWLSTWIFSVLNDKCSLKILSRWHWMNIETRRHTHETECDGKNLRNTTIFRVSLVFILTQNLLRLMHKRCQPDFGMHIWLHFQSNRARLFNSEPIRYVSSSMYLLNSFWMCRLRASFGCVLCRLRTSIESGMQ